MKLSILRNYQQTFSEVIKNQDENKNRMYSEHILAVSCMR